MTDIGSHHFVKSSAKSDKVLVPQPSNDPNDPLNWSRTWKFITITIATIANFGMGIGPLALAPMFGDLMEAFNTDLPSVVQFTGVCILVLGVPLSETIGRRPVLLFSSLVCLASMIWRAKATTYGSFMGACILNGFGAGPCETLQPQVITDVFFLHERGIYNTLFFTFYFGSLMAGPIIAGSMAFKVGWRSFWWLNVAFFAALIVLSIFLFPETKWHRVHPGERHGNEAETSIDMGENSASKAADQVSEPQQENAAVDPFLHQGRPSKRQFHIYQSNPNFFKVLLKSFWIPWKLHAFPIVEFAAFIVSWSASCFLTANLTQSQVFAAPPYNWSSQSVGFTNFATLAGAFIGLATNGPFSDWISMRATRRNRGIREPEMRLPAMLPYALISILGNFIIAFGYQREWDWKPIVIVGYTCAGIQVAALPAIASTYAIDSYKPVAGSVFVAITVNKNLWGYGFSKFITPWTESAGYIKPIMLNMCLATLWTASGILFYFRGKTFRKWTAKSDIHKN
ncbi:MFS transporter [Penicillium riverlandense]|uniref:MFS transporter n=1 Tax=Penicillium riverlandense TaxID=1903569 RepID=UPI002547F408|nr:MFS transporter [Penicillium riverlandense]KAJ5825424.1 MFS transporter [Penicillium riverlandense]